MIVGIDLHEDVENGVSGYQDNRRNAHSLAESLHYLEGFYKRLNPTVSLHWDNYGGTSTVYLVLLGMIKV